MTSDETPKIEPALTSIEDAPSIAPSAGEISANIAKLEAGIAQAKADNETVAKPAEPAIASEPSLPPAPTLSSPPEPELKPRAEATVTRLPALRAAQPSGPTAHPEIVVKPRVARFALLAASVAIAASFGAVGGSLGVAKFGPMLASAPPPAAPVTRDNVAEEVKSLKETVAQLRGTTKSLSDNLASLKTSVNSSNNAQNTQIGRIAETLDRVEKTQSEQRKTAAAAPARATPEITGSIATRPASTTAAVAAADPNAALKQSVVQGWVLRRVYDGAALIEGRDGIIEVETGSVAPGLGRIEGIKRQDGRWVVMTSRGLVVGR